MLYFVGSQRVGHNVVTEQQTWGTGKPGMLYFVGSQRVGHSVVTEQQTWGTGKPGMLYFVGSQRAGHSVVTEQQQNNCISWIFKLLFLLCRRGD